MLIKRIGFYLVGLSFGIVFITFIFNEKKTSCSYGPEARVIKNINSKKIVYNQKVLKLLHKRHIDTSAFKNALLRGDVNFKKSKPRQEPCGLYYIQLEFPQQQAAIRLENCEKDVTIKHIEMTPQL